MSDSLSFTVGFPRTAASSDCERYFKVEASHGKRSLFCPYGAAETSPAELLTADQREHARNTAIEYGREYVHRELRKMMEGIARKSRGTLEFATRGPAYKARLVVAKYQERSVDSELTCPECACRFQVFGIFGFCPGCQVENLLIYDADISIIRHEVQAGQADRALRRAYADLVSTFEIF